MFSIRFMSISIFFALLLLSSCSSAGYLETEVNTEIDDEYYTLDEAKELLYDEIYQEIYEEVYNEIYQEGFDAGVEEHTVEISSQLDDVLSGFTSFEDFVKDNY